MWVRIYITLFLLVFFFFLVRYWLKQTQRKKAKKHSNRRQAFWHKLSRLVNPLLNSVGMEPIWVMPSSEDALQERLDTVLELTLSINETLRANPYIDAAKKTAIKRQVRQMPANVVALAWKLHRLHKLQKLLGTESSHSQELTRLAERLKTEVDSAQDSLQNISVSLMKLELADNQELTAQLLDELSHTNQRMQDLLKAREVVQGR
jgi:hypothetical protein